MRRQWGWISLGLAGSILVTLAGPELAGSGATRWWFTLRIPPGRVGNSLALYGGMVALALAWFGLVRNRALRPRSLWLIGVVWSVPLLAGAPLFSKDLYSYLAQGTIVNLGLDPYHSPPTVLAHLGHRHVLDAVGPFWRGTTAPYGPLFLGLVSAVVSVSGAHLVLGAVLVRLLDFAGVLLVAVFVPRLAATVGGDSGRAIWLAALSPLVLLELISAGHNDALMAGLLVAGVTFAMQRRPLLGIVLCTVAATIKLPALAAVVFIAVAWMRSTPRRRAQLAAVGQTFVAVLLIAAAITVITGLGTGWLSTGIFSTPEKVRLAITPATALGWTAASLLHDVGIAVNARALESALGLVAFGFAAAFGAVLAWRTRFENLVRHLGLLLVVVAFCGPAAWPWYFSWGLVLLAATPAVQSMWALALPIAFSVFLVKANGILALPLSSAPFVLCAYAVAAVLIASAWRRRRLASAADRPSKLRRRASALAES